MGSGKGPPQGTTMMTNRLTLSSLAVTMLGDLEQGSMSLAECQGTYQLAMASLELIAAGYAEFDQAPGMSPRLDITGEGHGAMRRHLEAAVAG